MFLERFWPGDIFNAQAKGLRNRDYSSSDRPTGPADVVTRLILWLAPIVAGIVGYFLDLRIPEPDPILAAAGILTGALFMAFTQVAAWRDRFTARMEAQDDNEVNNRDSLDEAVAHVLVAIYVSLALAVEILIAAQFADDKGALTSVGAACALWLGLLDVLLLLVILPKLYAAYATVNELDDEMSGLST